QMRFNELVGGSVTDVSVSLYGRDLQALRAAAEQAAQVIEAVDGAEDVRVMAPPQVRLLEVRPRALDAARQGMSGADVLAHVQELRQGIERGDTYDGPLRIPIRVRLGSSIDGMTLEQAPVPVAGSLVPLSSVADVERGRGPALIDHDMAQRRIVVGLNVRGRDLGSVITDAEAAVARDVTVPEGGRVVWGGQYEGLQSARARLTIVIPGVLALIVGLLIRLFRRLRPALIILLNVPFAAVGGVVALTARGLPISVSAAVGFIALSGIAVMNGVVLMNALLDERAKGCTALESARLAARSRLRPVVMTAMVAALGFVPMTLAEGVGAEVQRPLATVVVGGLLTSTFLTLVILPALFPWLAGRAERPSSGAPV
ncbi:MAG: efflux RND transporter permease subunit, partial [Sandaracinaceae bacterium]